MENSNRSFAKVAIATLLIALGAQANSANAKNNNTNKDKAKAHQLVSKLTKNSWRLISVQNKTGRELLKFKFVKDPAQLSFRQTDKAVGFTFDIGCNTFASVLTVQGNTIKPDSMLSTRMYCADLNKIEKEFSRVMSDKSTLFVSKNGRQLVQIAGNGYKLVWRVGK